MIDENKKIIIFKRDCDDRRLGEMVYVRFISEDEKEAEFYNPLIAPRNFKYYLRQGKVLEAYNVTDYNVLKETEEMAYTFRGENGIYKVTKGIELDKKRMLLVDKGMNLNLNLPAYSYEIINDVFYVSPLKGGSSDNSYCYVIKDEDANDDLKRIMLPVVESIPGVLSVNTYPYEPTYAYKKKKR